VSETPAVQRTADRETIARAIDLQTFSPSVLRRILKHSGGTSTEGSQRMADAVLAVLVPADRPGDAVTLHAYTDEQLDQVRAETLEAAAEALAEHDIQPAPGDMFPGATYDYGPKVPAAEHVNWLRARAAEYRPKAAGA